MAPDSSLPALLALLTVTATLAPLAGAQSGSTSSSSGALAASTDLASYPPGGSVLFTLRNKGATQLNLTDARVEIHFGGSVLADIPLGSLELAPSASFVVRWNASNVAGNYFGWLHYKEPFDWYGQVMMTQHSVIILNPQGQSGWVIEPPAQAVGRLAVGTDKEGYAVAEPVTIIFLNAGTVDLQASDTCEVKFVIRTLDAIPVYDSAPGPVCAQVGATLRPGENTTRVWDQLDNKGQPVRPGSYRVEGQFGSAYGQATFSIVAPGNASAPLPPLRHLTLHGPRDPVPQGVGVGLVLLNSGTEALEGDLSVEVRDGANLVNASLQAGVRLQAGQSVPLTWDQKLSTGAQAPAGTYTITVRLAGVEASLQVTLAGATTAPQQPPTAPREPQPPAPAPPPEERPLIGRIAVNASATATGDYRGAWVSFRVDAESRRLLDFRVAGQLVLRELTLPASGDLRVEAETGALRIHVGLAVLVVYDTPAGALRFEAPRGGAQLGLTLPETAKAELSGGGASLTAPGLEALLLLHGEGTVTRDGARLRVALQEPSDGKSPGFVLRTWSGPRPSPPPEGLLDASAALKLALPGAIAAQRVAAEAYLAPAEGGAQVSVVPYVAGAVSVSVAKAEPQELTVIVDVEDPLGRTLVFHLDASLLPGAPGELRVLYDGLAIEAAASVEDVLNPDDDGLQAEFAVVVGDEGAQLLVSVPHFSVHTISVQDVSQLVSGLAPYGALAAAGVLAVAAAYMVRRGRQGP